MLLIILFIKDLVLNGIVAIIVSQKCDLPYGSLIFECWRYSEYFQLLILLSIRNCFPQCS